MVSSIDLDKFHHDLRFLAEEVMCLEEQSGPREVTEDEVGLLYTLASVFIHSCSVENPTLTYCLKF